MRPRQLVLALVAAVGSAIAASTPPACSYDDVETTPPEPAAWHLALVDTYYRLPVAYVPDDLTSVRSAGLDDDRTLREEVVSDLRALIEAGQRDGVRFELQSAYRSYDYQAQVFAGWVAALGMEAALRVSARPGHSEHQLGTAVDLRSAGGPAPWDLDDWALTAEGAWLQENAWRFGFVMSYPKGEEELTCYDYEPWHYRWLGREEAALLRSNGLTLREWLWRAKEGGHD